jgi:Ca2+-transporting ATPase
MLIPFMDGTQLEKDKMLEEVGQQAVKGERVIAVGIREIDDVRQINIHDKKHFNGITLLGTISFRDPLRPGVSAAIQEVLQAGIRTIIVTGDHAGTAIAVARELGMSIELDEVISGTELDKLSDSDLDHRLKRLKIVSRVSPEGKMRIAKAFQRKGEIVAMNGDGINDAPGLRQADIGIAMGSGTDVAKDVADLILLDDNFETIVAAIKEGRRIVENLRRAIVYLSSTIFNEILLIGGSIIAGIPLPLTALQILWVNFFTDSFPGLSLAFEEHLDGFKRQPAKLSRGLFTGEMRFILFINGLVSSTLLFLAYIGLLDRGFDPVVVKTFIFSAFGTYSLFLIFAVRSLKKSIFSYNPFSNMALVMSVLFGIALMAAAVYLPPLQNLFGTVALSAPWVIAVIVFGIVNILLIEVTKLLFREREVA